MWKKRLQILLWCLLGCGCIVLLVAAIQVKNRKTCSDIQIAIDDTGDRIFVDKKDVQKVLTDNKVLTGVPTESVQLGLLENELEKNVWVKDAQLFFDNNQVLTVKIEERQPLARIFTMQGSSFYIDSSASRLPLSEKFSAKVPVFTSFPSEKKMLTASDSMVLQDVKHIAQYIQQDSFWMAQVAQVDITPQHTYEMIPVLGNQVIVIGNAEGLDKKFKKLFAFYKQVWSKTGFEKYERIDVQYAGQVIAIKRGFITPVTDSAMAMQQYSTGLANMHAVVRDTLYAGAERRETDSSSASDPNVKKGKLPGRNGKPGTIRNGAVRNAKQGAKKKRKPVLQRNGG